MEGSGKSPPRPRAPPLRPSAPEEPLTCDSAHDSSATKMGMVDHSGFLSPMFVTREAWSIAFYVLRRARSAGGESAAAHQALRRRSVRGRRRIEPTGTGGTGMGGVRGLWVGRTPRQGPLRRGRRSARVPPPWAERAPPRPCPTPPRPGG